MFVSLVQSICYSSVVFSIMQNDISDVLDLTFSVDADEEKLILYEKTEVTTITCSAFFNCVFEMKFV